MAGNRLNILLITIDCWRADHLEDTSFEPSPVPHLNRLAANSLVFTQAVTGGGWTRPSLTALFSSTYPSMFGGPLNTYSTARPMLTEQLKSAGYETAGFTTNPQVGKEFGFERGFDTFVECSPDGNDRGLRLNRIRGGQRLLCKPLTHALLRPLGVHTLPPEITTPAGQLSQTVGSWMEQSHDRPFFVWAHYMDAHWPYHVLGRMDRPLAIASAWRDLQTMYRISLEHGSLNPGLPQVNRLKQLYREALGYIDESIGWLVTRMQRSGLLDRTAVIVTSDHGEEFYEHGRWGHYQLYDESLRVPLLIYLPETSPGQKIHRQVSLIDLAPTILSLAGAAPAGAMLGSSLLDGTDAGPAEGVAFAESMWPNVYRMAIRTPEYKFIFDDQFPGKTELYDLSLDPGERKNIYHSHAAVARQFDGLLQEQKARAEATYVEGQAASLDPAVSKRLRALGYIE